MGASGGSENRKRGLDKGDPIEAVTASCDFLYDAWSWGEGGLKGVTVSAAINGTALGQDVRMSRHGAEMAHLTCKSIGNAQFGTQAESQNTNE